jgi:hypothetical protein
MVPEKMLVTVMTDIGFNFSMSLEPAQPTENLLGAPPLSP